MRAEKVLHIDLYAASDQPIFREKLLVATLEAAHSEGSPKDPELISKWLNNDSNNPCLEHSWLIEIKIGTGRALLHSGKGFSLHFWTVPSETRRSTLISNLEILFQLLSQFKLSQTI